MKSVLPSLPALTPPAWILTHHLLQRALERGISDAQIQAVLADPDTTYYQPTFGPNRQIRRRGGLGVVVDLASRAVITVIFRDADVWARHLSGRVAA